MKILVILNDLDIGGAQNYTISLMNCFIRNGHKVELRVLSNHIPLRKRLDERVNIKVWARKMRLDFNVFLKIRKEILDNSYDGIIASYITYQKLATIFIKNLPITIYPIHSTIQNSKKAELLNYFTFRMKRKNEVFLTSIDNQTDYLVNNYKIEKDFFKQIYNGVDTDKFILPPNDFDREKFLKFKGIDPSNRVVLMVAGFRAEKRHIDAIDAFVLLFQKHKNMSLVFVGDNRKEECNKLKQYTSEKGIRNVHFFSADTAGDVKSFYWSATIFTLTSNKVETFSISALEAMSCGLPCVLTDIGGSKNFVKKNINGVLVEPNDVNSIKNGWDMVLYLIDSYNRNTIRKTVVNNYSLKNAATEYINLMKEGYAN